MGHHRLGMAIVYAAAAFAGLVVALIITFNLHILVGLEQGYAASPPEVFEHSLALGVFDLLLLIAAPAFGVVVVRRLRRHQPR